MASDAIRSTTQEQAWVGTHTHTHTHTHIHTHAKSEWRMVDAFAEWVLECRFVFRFLATSLLSFEGV
jgi:hypothetical protein